MKAFLVALLLVGTVAEARVFNFAGEKFAPYLKGQYGPTTSGDSAFATSSGAGNTFSTKNTYNSGYEFGFAYGIKGVRFKFGFEILRPPLLDGVKGSDSGGTELYTLKSDIVGFSPKFGIEMNIAEWPLARIYAVGDYGAAQMTLKNTYAFTAAGAAAYPGMTDFTEELKASGTAIDGALGFEALVFDTTTLTIEVGYRTLKFGNLKHNQAVNSFQGSVAKGDSALNDDGTAREINHTGLYAAAGFRFWIF